MDVYSGPEILQNPNNEYSYHISDLVGIREHCDARRRAGMAARGFGAEEEEAAEEEEGFRVARGVSEALGEASDEES